MIAQERKGCRLPAPDGRNTAFECRDEVVRLLNEVYGYRQFRELEIYKDLSAGKEKMTLSQGQLIEHVKDPTTRITRPRQVYVGK